MIGGILTLIALSKGPMVYQFGKNVEYDQRIEAMASDCSGFVISVLYDAGIFLPDMTAKDLYQWCKKQKGGLSSEECDSLLFFGKSEETISHVAISIDGVYMIEVAGSDASSLKMTKEELLARNARSRIRRIDSRSDFFAGVKIPFNN